MKNSKTKIIQLKNKFMDEEYWSLEARGLKAEKTGLPPNCFSEGTAYGKFNVIKKRKAEK